MDPHLILAYKLGRLGIRPMTAFFSTHLNRAELRAMFRPWKDWCRVEKSEGNGRATISCAVYEVPPLRRLIGTFAQQPAHVLYGDFADIDAVDVALVQEVAHHDFELGGKNEWDGSPVKYSRHVLKLLSAVHCVDYFPTHIFPELERLRQRRGAPLRALDVGCGPITWLRHGRLRGWLEITGVDPLLDVYKVVLQRHGLSNLEALLPQVCICIAVENLPETCPGLCGQFDLAWTNNALDHTREPDAALAAIAFALHRDGLAVIQVATNEGTRQHWSQLHRFDIDFDGSHVTATNESGRVTQLIGDGCPLMIDRVLKHSADGLTVVARHHGAPVI